MDTNVAASLARYLMNQHGLNDWYFEWSRSLTIFGSCHYHSKKITLSYKIVRLNTDSEVRDTILHEIAHALCGPNEGHGWGWKQMCLRVGAKPVACYSESTVKTPPKKYLGKCPCGQQYSMCRLRRGAIYRCKLCKYPVQWFYRETAVNV